MKLDDIYNNNKALRDTINTLLDFIASKGLAESAIAYVANELDMSIEDATDLVAEGIQ